MIDDFKVYSSLIFIFSNDMSKVLLNTVNDKLDGYLYQNNIKKFSEIEISKKIKSELNLEIEPQYFRTVVTLQNIEKKFHLTVLMSFSDIEKITDYDRNVIIPIDNIPCNCLPQLRWIIPLCIDTTIYGSDFNQILIK